MYLIVILVLAIIIKDCVEESTEGHTSVILKKNVTKLGHHGIIFPEEISSPFTQKLLIKKTTCKPAFKSAKIAQLLGIDPENVKKLTDEIVNSELQSNWNEKLKKLKANSTRDGGNIHNSRQNLNSSVKAQTVEFKLYNFWPTMYMSTSEHPTSDKQKNSETPLKTGATKRMTIITSQASKVSRSPTIEFSYTEFTDEPVEEDVNTDESMVGNTYHANSEKQIKGRIQQAFGKFYNIMHCALLVQKKTITPPGHQYGTSLEMSNNDIMSESFNKKRKMVKKDDKITFKDINYLKWTVTSIIITLILLIGLLLAISTILYYFGRRHFRHSYQRFSDSYMPRQILDDEEPYDVRLSDFDSDDCLQTYGNKNIGDYRYAPHNMKTCTKLSYTDSEEELVIHSLLPLLKNATNTTKRKTIDWLKESGVTLQDGRYDDVLAKIAYEDDDDKTKSCCSSEKEGTKSIDTQTTPMSSEIGKDAFPPRNYSKMFQREYVVPFPSQETLMCDYSFVGNRRNLLLEMSSKMNRRHATSDGNLSRYGEGEIMDEFVKNHLTNLSDASSDTHETREKSQEASGGDAGAYFSLQSANSAERMEALDGSEITIFQI